ncbi:MAG: glycosyltransferase, partial [Pirellulales bacterium]|nr:glycosyltransferase [Pirellulales bacterium]
MPLRVLHIIPSLAQHGTAKQLRLVAEGLAAKGYDVHVCVLAGAPHAYQWCADLAEHGVESTIVTHRSRCDATCLPALIGRLRAICPDVVHTWLPAGNFFGRLAARSAGTKHIVSSIRHQDPYAPGWQWLAERLFDGRTDAIAVNSVGVRQHAVRQGLDASKVHVVPNAVEPAVPSQYSREECFEMFDLPDDARLMAAVGTLERSKNLKQQIWVADIFKGIHEPVHLLLLGEGPQQARLDAFARQIEVRHRVRFAGHREDVLDILPH